MANENLDTPAYQPPEWVEGLSPSQKRDYEESRQRDIEAFTSQVWGIIDAYLPGIAETHPEAVEALAVRWATGLRNQHEGGMQAGKDAWDPRGYSYEESFMRNAVGN